MSVTEWLVDNIGMFSTVAVLSTIVIFSIWHLRSPSDSERKRLLLWAAKLPNKSLYDRMRIELVAIKDINPKLRLALLRQIDLLEVHGVVLSASAPKRAKKKRKQP